MERIPYWIKFYISNLLLIIPFVAFFSDRPYYVIAGIALLSLFYLILVKPTKAVYLLPLLLEFPFVLIPNTYLHLAEFAVVILMISTLFHVCKYQLRITMPMKKNVMLIFMAGALSFIGSTYLRESFLTMIRLLVALGFVFPLVYSVIDTEKKIYRLTYAFIIAGLVAAVYGILENYVKTGGMAPNLGSRIFAKAGSFYGSFLGMATLGVFSLALFRTFSHGLKTLMLASIVPMALAMFMSQTRAWIVATLTALISVVAMKIYHSGRLKLSSVIVSITLLLGIMFGAISTDLPYKIAGKFLTRQRGPVTGLTISRTPDFSTIQRIRFWKFGWRQFLKHPLTGVGLGNVRISNKYANLQLVEPVRGTPYVDSQYLHVPIETGLIGILAWLSLILPIVVISIRNVSRSINSSLQAVSVFLVGALILNGVGGIFWVLTANYTTLSILTIIFSMVLCLDRLLGTGYRISV